LRTCPIKERGSFVEIFLQVVQQLITITKDVFTCLAAITAAVVAILGLQAWKKQLRGKTEYELAQRLLKSVYKVRNAFAIVRNPMQSNAEIAQAMRDAKIEGDPLRDQTVKVRSEEAVYQKRWQNVQEAFLELESHMLEAEALWGEDVKKYLQSLNQCAAKLFLNIQRYLQNEQRPPRAGAPYDREAEREIETIIYSWPADSSDENPFTNEINDVVRQVENFLKPRLKL
jgi:hypothetical protein